MTKFIRFCPDCGTQLTGPDAHGGWSCPNENCDVTKVIYPPLRRNDLPPVKIIRASRPILKVRQ